MKIFLLATYLILITLPAKSYFDPGTGAMIVQAIVAFVSSIIIFFSSPIYHIKKFYKKIKDKLKKEKIEK